MEPIQEKFRKIIQNIQNSGGKLKIGRNDKCLCGSGLKFKRCCWKLFQNDGTVSPEQQKAFKKEERYWKKRYNSLVKNQQKCNQTFAT